MNLPSAPAAYDRGEQNIARQAIREADSENLKRGRDAEVGPGARVILTSPNNSRFAVTVSNAGALVVTPL